MRNSLLDGIPKESDYRLLLESKEFKDLERLSNHFLSVNKKNLEGYAKKWVEDPLHQWSRQWEYPFVFSRIQPILETKGTAKILDAGSGVTFFPYYIKSQYDYADIYCNDYDTSLEGIFHRINANGDNKIKFSCSDLRELRYENGIFDVIYCISVLEHTDDYVEIIEGFNRILKPSGRLIITFDISLDGKHDISVEKGTALLKSLTEQFDYDKDISLDIRSYVSMPGIFTTLTANNINANLLPWKYPTLIYRIRSLIAGKGFCSWPPPLTVFCLGLTKRST